MKHTPSRVKAQSAFVICVYPVIAIASFVGILVPRAHLLSEALTQWVFMAGMYQLWCLFIGYCDGEAELVQKVKPENIILTVGPCCCWPCCFCLPKINVTKKSLLWLRIQVLQLPLVQGFVYMILLIMWAERESLYSLNYMYFQPIIVISILFGIWAMIMTINLIKNVLEDGFNLSKKFLALQMILIFAKLQGLITRSLVWTDVLPCKLPITPIVYANLIYNTLMMFEMVLLGYIARKLYKTKLPMDDLKINIKTNLDIKNNNANCECPRTDFSSLTISPSQNYGHVNVAADIEN